MADDTSKRGARDRAQVAGDEPYEVDYFADKHGISAAEAKALIERVGNDRAELDAAAAGMSGAAPRRSNAKRSTSPRGSKSTTRAATSKNSAKPSRSKATATDTLGQRIKTGASDATTALRRGVTGARNQAAAMPAALRRQTADAVDGAKTAVTSQAAKLVGAAAVGLAAGLAVNLGRKAVVQAPSALAGDWLEAVKVEHKLAMSLFDQLQATDDTDTGKRSVLLVQLKHALGKHAFMEENVLYPALRDWGDKADADKLNHDHGYVKQSLFELEAMDKAAPAFLATVARFRADLEAHISEEENSVFPPLHAALGPERNAELTAMANKEGFKLA